MCNKKQLNPYFAILYSHGGIDYKCTLLSLTWRFGHSTLVGTFSMEVGPYNAPLAWRYEIC